MIKHYMPQRSPEWYEIRRGKVTGTRMKSIILPKSEPLKIMDEIIAEDVSGMSDDEDGFINDDMQRGIDLEPVACAAYADIMGCEIQEVGFIQSERWPNLGMSPDGLVGEVGQVQVKCPKTKTHVKYLRENVLPKEYFAQILSCFLVDDKLFWVDFISYDPRFAVRPLFIYRINRSDLQKELIEASAKVDKFFRELDALKTQIIFGTSITIDHAPIAE
jgi:hypothetical protein